MSDKLYSDLNKGAWSSETAYTVGDFVSHNGSSYTCIANSTGNEPPNATYWSLLSSKGDQGDAGEEVELQVSGGYIQWKHSDDVSWTNLIEVATLKGDTGDTGATGAPGADGTEIELQKTATHIQWRLVGGAWADLVALTEITGPTGEKGATGDNGSDGTDGDDGKTILNGSVAPTTEGVDGDFYINTTTNEIYGPKTSGAWGEPTSLVGPTGATGPAGEGSGDVLGPSTNNADYLPQWNGADSKTLKNGVAIPAGGLAGITALGGKVDKNTAITGATKTKITYDTKGLVTSGADATTADIADSENKRYVTDAEKVIIGNTSGSNSGDQDLSTLIAKTTDVTSINDTGIADGEIPVFNKTNKDIRTSDKVFSTDGTLAGNSDSNIPTEKAVKTYADTMLPKSLVDAKGDLITASADNTPARLAVGTNGQSPIADSSKTTGLSWFDNNFSMARQAIINGNFDVWQRGTSFTATPFAAAIFSSDRWRGGGAGTDGGTNPTITISRQLLTSGDIPNAFYHHRVNVNGAGSSYGVNSHQQITQRIEHGARFLCGDGKKVTVSFWAKSDIANKRLGIGLSQYYGSTGSPSATEVIISEAPITLTSTWTKYVMTFTTNTLSGKTFGIDNNDYLDLRFSYQWGTTGGNTYVYPSVTAESFVGSGNIDIAQVQLCAGDVALPFMPKSFEEELRACQRYCYGINTDQTNSIVGFGYEVSTTVAGCHVSFPVEMRAVPAISPALTAGDWQIADGTATKDCTDITLSTTGCSKKGVLFVCTVADSLAVSRPCRLQGDGTANRILILSAEI